MKIYCFTNALFLSELDFQLLYPGIHNFGQRLNLFSSVHPRPRPDPLGVPNDPIGP